MTATPSHPHTAMTRPHASEPNPPEPGAKAEPEPGNAPAHYPAALAEPAASRTGSAAGRLRAAAADNLMVAIFGPIIVLLLGYSLYTTNDRFDNISNDFAAVNDRFTAVDDRFTALEASIDRRFAAIDDRFTALETSIDRRFAAQDAKIAALHAKFDEINLKLTVLIAALNKTDEVEAAIAGEVTATVSSATSRPPP